MCWSVRNCVRDTLPAVWLESACYRLCRCCRRFCCCCCAAAGLLFFSYDFKNESFSCWSSIVKTTRLTAISLSLSLSLSVILDLLKTEFWKKKLKSKYKILRLKYAPKIQTLFINIVSHRRVGASFIKKLTSSFVRCFFYDQFYCLLWKR